MKGKDKCEILKKIRSDFAQKNGIDYSPSQCTFSEDCNGVCPICEEEANMLLQRVKENETIASEIIPINGSSISYDFNLLDDNYIETDNDINIENDELGGDISGDIYEHEDIVEMEDQEISLDNLITDISEDDDLDDLI